MLDARCGHFPLHRVEWEKIVRKLISTGSPMEKQAGYSRAVIDGDWIFISGTTGFDYETMVMPVGIVEQTHNCFATIAKVLGDAGAGLDDIVRINYVVSDREYVDIVFPIFGEYLGAIRPAATLIVAGLMSENMKIEIEVTAHRMQKGDLR